MIGRISVGLAVSAVLMLAAPAAAGANDAVFEAASADGTHVFFATDEQMVAGDTDSASDIYERFGNATTLISTGPTGGNASGQTAFFEDASDDGSIVLFRTFESLVAGDTDDDIDLYQRTGTTTTLLSTGPTGGNGDFDVSFAGASADGTLAYFETGESLIGTDTDSSTDVYLRQGASTIHISRGAINGNGAFNAFFRGAADNGSSVFFTTSEPLVAGDTDTSTDIYQRSGSTTTQISAGAINGNGAFSAAFVNSSFNGTRVLFTTSEPLVATDTDTSSDVYERSGSTTTLMSAGAINGNGSFSATFRGASGDGSRVFFTTAEQLVSVDTDSAIDIYERESGVTTRMSGEATGDNGAFDAIFEGASDPGTTVFWSTAEQIRSGDTDNSIDIYAHLDDGTVDGISADHTAPDGDFDVTFGGNSLDGSQVYFTTQEAFPGSTDQDESSDVYQYDFGFNFSFRVSGPAINFDGGQGGFPAKFADASTDGSRVFFTSFEQLAPQDIDGARDVYGTFVGSSLISRETKPPDTTIGAGVPPSGFTNDTTPVFSFTSSEPGSTFKCRVVPASFTNCASPEVFGPLADGSRTIEVQATDVAGNVDPTPAARTFTVDTLAPDPSIDTGPEGLTSDPTPTFTFSADEAVTFACRVDGAAYAACSAAGSHTTAALSEGDHKFKLRARDAAGNTTFVHQRFTVDSIEPETVIDSVKVKKRNATVNFSGTDTPPGSPPLSFECKLDSAGFKSCANGHQGYKHLARGAHTVQVRATDAAGNVDSSPASKNFSV